MQNSAWRRISHSQPACPTRGVAALTLAILPHSRCAGDSGSRRALDLHARSPLPRASAAETRESGWLKIEFGAGSAELQTPRIGIGCIQRRPTRSSATSQYRGASGPAGTINFFVRHVRIGMPAARCVTALLRADEVSITHSMSTTPVVGYE
jgi:hypothetical protein